MFKYFPTTTFLILVCGILSSASNSESIVQTNALRFRRQAPDSKCGLSTTGEEIKLNSSVTNASSTRVSKFPWLAALYYKDKDDKWEHRCQGTLITGHLVVTVAHCIMQNGGTLRPEELKVGLGKYYHDFNREEKSSIISEVKEVVVPSQYTGQKDYYTWDIALLHLAESVQVTDVIMPACVDWSHSLKPTHGSVLHVGAWSIKEPYGHKKGDTVLSIQLKYLENEECLKKTKGIVRRFLTDKFCSEYTEGVSLNGASGSPVTYVKHGAHFVIGILSNKILDQLSLSTNITHDYIASWLKAEKQRLELS